MISLHLTEEEVVEVANSAVFTAYCALEDDDEEAWRVARVTVAVLAKIEAAHQDIIESDAFLCARELLVLRRRVAKREKQSD